jgi:hypothetical protein
MKCSKLLGAIKIHLIQFYFCCCLFVCLFVCSVCFVHTHASYIPLSIVHEPNCNNWQAAAISLALAHCCITRTLTRHSSNADCTHTHSSDAANRCVHTVNTRANIAVGGGRSDFEIFVSGLVEPAAMIHMAATPSPCAVMTSCAVM